MRILIYDLSCLDKQITSGLLLDINSKKDDENDRLTIVRPRNMIR
jgi:hypothetical protein